MDDTMVEKEGNKFELRSRLFDHAAHNGSHYLNGHCMVSILPFPVLADGSIRYLSVPLGYRLWDKKQTKLEIAAEMVRQAMDGIGTDRQVFLLCDSWYSKGCVAGLVNEYYNLDIICNARIDTVMYDLPPKRTGKRGRPKKYGERLSPEVFELEFPKTGDWKIGVRPMLTRLWGERVHPESGCKKNWLPRCKNRSYGRLAAGCPVTDGYCRLPDPFFTLAWKRA